MQPIDGCPDLVGSEPSLSKALADLGDRELTAREPAEGDGVRVRGKLCPHSRIAVLVGLDR